MAFVIMNLGTRQSLISMVPSFALLKSAGIFDMGLVVLPNWLGKHMVRDGRVQLDGRKVVNLTLYMLNISGGGYWWEVNTALDNVNVDLPKP